MEFGFGDNDINLMLPLSPPNKARKWLEDPDSIFLETRSTGIGDYAEILEIIICNYKGSPLFHSLVNPTTPCSQSILTNYNITAKNLEKAPNWHDIVKKVRSLLSGKPIIVFNSRLDGRLMKQSSKAITGKTPQWVNDLDFCGVMKLAEQHFESADNDYQVITLKQACEDAGILYIPSHNIRKELLIIKQLLMKIAA